MRRVICFVLCLLTCCLTGCAKKSVVPEWFLPTSQDPYAVFNAWRHLTTREAVLVLGKDWKVCAGVLQDKKGEPISNCVLGFTFFDGIRPHSAVLKTDANGRFIIYSPYGGLSLKTDHVSFSAAPLGCPFPAIPATDMDFVAMRIIPVSKDRCFCVLTSARQSKYSEAEAKESVERQMIEWKNRQLAPYREEPRTREGTVGRGIRNEYSIKVVAPGGVAISNAGLKFSAYDQYEGNYQVVRTDADGKCTLTEELLSGQNSDYYARVQRWLTLDIPGYAVGPMSFNFKTNELNVVTAKEGARVCGRVIDWNGNPFRRRVRVVYRNKNHVSFELYVLSDPEGYFVIDRIMPGEPFKLLVEGRCQSFASGPNVWSDTFNLKDRQILNDVVLKVPQAAALRGIVVDEEDRPVTSIWQVEFQGQDDYWVDHKTADGKFGAFGVTPGPLKIKVRADGFVPYMSEQIQLEPGELRFVKVVMKKEALKP